MFSLPAASQAATVLTGQSVVFHIAKPYGQALFSNGAVFDFQEPRLDRPTVLPGAPLHQKDGAPIVVFVRGAGEVQQLLVNLRKVREAFLAANH